MLQKQTTSLNFSQGLDTKTDPKQVPLGKYLKLENSVFTTLGRLTKRNGYGALTPLPNQASYLTTFSGNLTAVGTGIQAYSKGSGSWVSKGAMQPLSLNVLPTVRSSLNETQCDSVISLNGLVCTVYTEINNSVSTYKYTVSDYTTGQNIVSPTVIPVTSGVVTGSPRVFLLGGYFIIVFTNVISTVSHLQYVAVSTSSPSTVTANQDLVASYTASPSLNWDGVVVGSNLYVGYNTTSGGQQVQLRYLSPSLTVSAPVSFAGSIATIMSLTSDQANSVIYASFYDSVSKLGSSLAVDSTLNVLMTPTQTISTLTVSNITSSAQSGVLTVIYEVTNFYSYDGALQTNYLNKVSVTKPSTVTTGTVGSTSTLIRSLGLASKSFLYNSKVYVLASYQSTLQNTYFLLDSSGNLIARFAYENGGGYLTKGLAQAQVIGSTVSIAYLYKTLIQSQNTLSSPQSAGKVGKSNIYSQTGVNLMSISFTSQTLSSTEIGQNLQLSGGFLWSYDGQTLSEQGFHLFPDNIEITTSGTGGLLTAQQYYYQVVYEWTDSAGNIIRSAPSVPISVTTTGTTSSNTLNIPYLRLTYKPNVKIVIYRWSQANQIYYQITSIQSPILNNPLSDSYQYVDTVADSSIVGNSIIYTNGGVLEDLPGPSATAMTLFDNRLWLISAEDQNLLYNSKQVIQGTPVEMSDLLTTYVAPSTAVQGPTGVMKCLYPLDDKLIIFKKNAIYYLSGTGPDNTGANSQYGQPVFITSSVGCSNQNSIVVLPTGLMFQSDKGIWLLGKDLSTNYIGKDVEMYNGALVNSAVSIPGTTHVRLTLSTGVILMYDYFVGQWGTFKGCGAISSTLYQGLHTYINAIGQVAQETPGVYLDLSNPVLMSFTTSWLNLTGLQGYQRAYFFYLMGKYISPHKLQVGIAYDYNPTFISSPLISPTNYTQNYGSVSPYGQNHYGGLELEQWRVFFSQQRCQAFQISVTEQYDASLGVSAGEGLNLSGLNIVYGQKSAYKPGGKSVG